MKDVLIRQTQLDRYLVGQTINLVQEFDSVLINIPQFADQFGANVRFRHFLELANYHRGVLRSPGPTGVQTRSASDAEQGEQ